ncbi:MAG: alkaline phosphatase family protein [Cellvibrionaceae bacterium]
MKKGFIVLVVSALVMLAATASAGFVKYKRYLIPIKAGAKAEYVIHISVDGLYAPAISLQGKSRLPNFFRLQREGASTLAARTDSMQTNTLPNHVSQLTGRSVARHRWRTNAYSSGSNVTLHNNAGVYIAGVFDVVHDAGLSTSLFASKSKFSLFNNSWNAKIDKFRVNSSTSTLTDEFIADLKSQERHYAFLHLRDPDSSGHKESFDLQLNSAYMRSIRDVDRYLGKIINYIKSSSRYGGKTAIILTSDHGGTLGKKYHSPNTLSSHIIPFYIWGGNSKPAANLYGLNEVSSHQPNNTEAPNYNGKAQPVRNGDAANVAARLLGLASIPGSTIKTVTNW